MLFYVMCCFFLWGNSMTCGYVGIGTTTPSNKLTVSGNADVTGNVGIGTYVVTKYSCH